MAGFEVITEVQAPGLIKNRGYSDISGLGDRKKRSIIPNSLNL